MESWSVSIAAFYISLYAKLRVVPPPDDPRFQWGYDDEGNGQIDEGRNGYDWFPLWVWQKYGPKRVPKAEP
jgi:hypothetical protein